MLELSWCEFCSPHWAVQWDANQVSHVSSLISTATTTPRLSFSQYNPHGKRDLLLALSNLNSNQDEILYLLVILDLICLIFDQISERSKKKYFFFDRNKKWRNIQMSFFNIEFLFDKLNSINLWNFYRICIHLVSRFFVWKKLSFFVLIYFRNDSLFSLDCLFSDLPKVCFLSLKFGGGNFIAFWLFGWFLYRSGPRFWGFVWD